MIFITGDTHRNFSRVQNFCDRFKPQKSDILIILGDAGINYYGDNQDNSLKEQLAELPITLFCIHGNHERRPQTIPAYHEMVWHEGTVYIEPDYPSLLFAKDGEVFVFDNRKCIVIGGAYSIDKQYRLNRGWHWWDDEQPSDEIKARTEKQLERENWRIDVMLSHTCPLKYEPIEAFIPGIRQHTVDKGTEEWLGKVEERLNYLDWFCGHYHITKDIHRLHFLYEDIRVFTLSEDASD